MYVSVVGETVPTLSAGAFEKERCPLSLFWQYFGLPLVCEVSMSHGDSEKGGRLATGVVCVH